MNRYFYTARGLKSLKMFFCILTRPDHGGSAADHGGGSIFVSDESYDDVVLDRVKTTLANRSDFIRVNNGLLGSVSQSTRSAG
ncbi:hypothetical protein Hanom_Chr14g01263691 [Helianthus anomalus]